MDELACGTGWNSAHRLHLHPLGNLPMAT
jgi:hypothetical protein